MKEGDDANTHRHQDAFSVVLSFIADHYVIFLLNEFSAKPAIASQQARNMSR